MASGCVCLPSCVDGRFHTPAEALKEVGPRGLEDLLHARQVARAAGPLLAAAHPSHAAPPQNNNPATGGTEATRDRRACPAPKGNQENWARPHLPGTDSESRVRSGTHEELQARQHCCRRVEGLLTRTSS